MNNPAEKSFCTFSTMAYGYRAAWKIMSTYYLRLLSAKKPFTLRTIIHSWAPECENNTQAYVATVAKLGNLSADTLLHDPKKDEGMFTCILAAMTCVECGIGLKEVDLEAIEEGFELAFRKLVKN